MNQKIQRTSVWIGICSKEKWIIKKVPWTLWTSWIGSLTTLHNTHGWCCNNHFGINLIYILFDFSPTITAYKNTHISNTQSNMNEMKWTEKDEKIKYNVNRQRAENLIWRNYDDVEAMMMMMMMIKILNRQVIKSLPSQDKFGEIRLQKDAKCTFGEWERVRKGPSYP